MSSFPSLGLVPLYWASPKPRIGMKIKESNTKPIVNPSPLPNLDEIADQTIIEAIMLANGMKNKIIHQEGFSAIWVRT